MHAGATIDDVICILFRLEMFTFAFVVVKKAYGLRVTLTIRDIEFEGSVYLLA
jgi:hypothetical protein